MKSKILLIVSLFLFGTGCKKREYPEEKIQLEKEEIYFTGYVDNEPISLKIGTDGYYCYSSHKQLPDSVYVFEGVLKKFDCNSCTRALKMELSDYRQRLPGSSVAVDSSLRTGARHFIPGLSKTTTVKFVSRSNKKVASLRWNLSNGISSQDSMMSYEFGQPGAQTVSLTIKTEDNCESTVINKIYVGGTSGLFACDISATTVQNNSEFTPATIGGKQPLRYTWYFGDGDISHDIAPGHSYKWSGSYPVKLRIEDADNHVCESNYIHVAGTDKSSCAANMSLSYTGSKNAFLDGVKLQWIDASGVVLRSDSVAQPAGSYFEVMNSQDYAPNERGEPGRLLTLRFNVLLSDGNRKVWFKSENTAMAVTYK